MPVAGDWLRPNTKGTDMNKLITFTKVALVVSLLASSLTGCCLFGNDGCCKKDCEKTCCCTPGSGKKTSGINTSMTLGVGTDGLSVGSESNIGSHGASGSISTY